MKRLAMMALAIAASGCVATGVKVTEQQLAGLQPGVTTKQDTVAALGNPTTQTRNADGTRTLYYNYTRASARPETYIPFVGAFIGGADSQSTIVTLRFDAEGKLLDHSSSESAYGTGMGVAAGQVPRVADQPTKP